MVGICILCSKSLLHYTILLNIYETTVIDKLIMHNLMLKSRFFFILTFISYTTENAAILKLCIKMFHISFF